MGNIKATCPHCGTANQLDETTVGALMFVTDKMEHECDYCQKSFEINDDLVIERRSPGNTPIEQRIEFKKECYDSPRDTIKD